MKTTPTKDARLLHLEEQQRELTEFVRAYIRALKGLGYTYSEIGNRLGVSSTYVHQIEKVEKYGSANRGLTKVEHNLAWRFYERSVDSLRHAARTLASGVTLVIVDDGDTLLLSCGSDSLQKSSSAPPKGNPGH